MTPEKKNIEMLTHANLVKNPSKSWTKKWLDCDKILLEFASACLEIFNKENQPKNLASPNQALTTFMGSQDRKKNYCR